MKTIDERNSEHKTILVGVRIYPFLKPDDVVRFDGHIAVQAFKSFDVVPTGLWQVRISINIEPAKAVDMQWVDHFMYAMQYARILADIDLLTDANKPLPEWRGMQSSSTP